MLVDYKNVNIYQQAETPVLSNVDFHVDEARVHIHNRTRWVWQKLTAQDSLP